MRFARFFGLLSRGLVAAALLSLLTFSTGLRAQNDDSHVVSSAQLQQQVTDSAANRQKDIQTLTNFLSTPEAEQAMKSAKVDPVQVRTAIPTLSNAELANLSARASTAQQQFAAGGLGRGLLTLIIIAIVVIIIVAVVA